jgi:hypothetical protein
MKYLTVPLVASAVFLAATLLGSQQEANAGQLHCRPLKEVIGNAQRVMVAKVLDIRAGQPIVYQVQVVRDLLKKQAAGKTELRFSYPQAESKQPDGSIVVKSILADCSGHEHEPKVGQEWIFISPTISGDILMRVEPISSEAAVRDLLNSEKRGR